MSHSGQVEGLAAYYECQIVGKAESSSGCAQWLNNCRQQVTLGTLRLHFN
jgi:hypothetical protein